MASRICARETESAALSDARRVVERLESFQDVEIAVADSAASKSEKFLHDGVAHLLAPEPVHRRVRQDALEQQRQFGRRPVDVLLGQPDHRVLHDVQRGVVVANGVDRPLEGPLFDALEEVGEFFVGCQVKRAWGACPRRRARLSHRVTAAPSTGRSVPQTGVIMLLCTTARVTSWTSDPGGPSILTAQVPTPASRGRGEVHRWFFVREIHKGSNMDMSAAEVKRAASAQPHSSLRRAERLGNPGPLPSGRRRQVPLGLPRRRGPLHLRRAVQAGHDRARAGAPRAGGRACRRRLCARHRRGRRRAGHLGPGRHECRHRHRHRVHGLDPDGDHHRAGADAGDRPRRLPGMRHGRHHAADRQAQLPRQGRARPRA